MNSRRTIDCLCAALLCLGLVAPALLASQSPSSPSRDVPGIATFRPVTVTIACGSDAAQESMPALKQAGFSTIVSFTEDTEPGYDRPTLERAAAAAGLRYVSIPFNRDRPDPAAAERFLEVIAAPDTGAAYLSCRTGQRAAAMWAIKRVRQDGWSLERAMAEAKTLGLTRPELERFVTEFAGMTAR